MIKKKEHNNPPSRRPGNNPNPAVPAPRSGDGPRRRPAKKPAPFRANGRPAMSSSFSRQGRQMHNAGGRIRTMTFDPNAKNDGIIKKGEHPLRVIPLGGLEEVGRNMMYFEYEDDIIIIDAGIQFPEDETPGIDYIIPNIDSLEKKKDKIRALILTHGHYDHIGAIPYIMDKIGNPPVYATSITRAMVEKRQEDFPNSPKLKLVTVTNHMTARLGKNFEAYFFGVDHTIPETTGVMLKTPVGNLVSFADFKIEYDEDDNPQGLEEYARLGEMGVSMFFVDSTNATRPGHSISERTVEKNLEELFRNAEGRLIIATFASLLTRIAEIIKIAEKIGRVVALNGYSMKANIQIAQTLGFVKAKEGTIIPIEEIHKYRNDKIMILTTGAQGESNAGLMKMVTGEHRFVGIKPGDTVIFSSSVIPGNERSIQTLQDNLARQGAIVYNSGILDIHSSGHAPKDDLRMVMKLLKPKYLVPIHGYYFMRSANAQTGKEAGIKKENIFLMDNGQVGELRSDSFRISNETVPAYYVMVDGLGVGDVEEVVIRDRINLSQEGMIVMIITLDRQTGQILKNPDIISRGFIFVKENQGILEEIRKRLKGVIGRLPNYQEVETDYLKTLIRDQVGQFVYNKTHRRPMLLPVIIEI